MRDKLATFRLPVEIDKEIDDIASIEDSDKSKLIRELIVIGLREKRLNEAIKSYSDGKISLWKASKLANLSLWRIIEIIRERKIVIQYGENELKEDLKALDDNF